MIRTHKRLISVAMVLVLAMSTIPFSSSAYENDKYPQESFETSSTNMVHEVIELREENIKHFALPDGSYQAIAYSHPIHQKDKQGNWQTIDNSLNLQPKANSSTYTTCDNRVSFPQVYAAGKPIMTLQYDNYNISMLFLPNQFTTSTTTELLSAKVRAAKVQPNQTSFLSIEDAINADYTEAITYKNVSSNTDLEYIVDGNAIKENIVIHSPAPTYAYSFAFTMTNLYARKEADGSIGIYDSASDKLRYAIPSPYMYDANYNTSLDVSYELTGESGKYFLSITANEEWVNAPDRVFPVTIDPTFTYATEQVQDSYIDSDYPDTVRYLSPLLWVRSNRISFIKTPNLTLPEGAVVTSAQLQAWYYYLDNITTGYVDVGAYQINRNWSGNTLTWNNMSNYPNRGLDTYRLDKQRASVGNATETSPKRLIFNITAAVRNWADGDPNYGIALRYETSPNLSVLFKSYESSSSYKPRIVYQYSIADTCYKIKNCYDSTFDATRASMILPAINALSQVYHAQFGISFEMYDSAFNRNDLVDACSLGSDYACTALGCGSNHHKDVVQIMNTLTSEVSGSNEKIVYWTDHRFNIYCEHDSEGNCSPYNSAALAITTLRSPAIHVLRLPIGASDSTMYRACMIYILAHEMAHSLGLDEQYIYQVHEDSAEDCVMKIYNFDAAYFVNLIAKMEASKVFFCESCTSLLRNEIHSPQSE